MNPQQPKNMGKPTAIDFSAAWGRKTTDIEVNSDGQTHNKEKYPHQNSPTTKFTHTAKIVPLRPLSQLSVWVKFQDLCMRRRMTVSMWGWEIMEEWGHPLSSYPCEGEWVYWWSVHVGKDWQSSHTPLPSNNCPTNIRGFNVVVDWLRQGKAE